MNGIVIRNTGSWYTVITDDGAERAARLKGLMRMSKTRTTNPVSVGDHVRLEITDEGEALIADVLPRKNYIIRRASNLSKESHILASNIDLALLMITLRTPQTTTMFIDRYLATAEAYGIPTVLLFNKADCLSGDDLAECDSRIGVYSRIGYTCLKISALQPDDIRRVTALIEGKVSLLSGHSGVGKSTLINGLLGDEVARTGEISAYHRSGKHTTTFSEMYPLPSGGYVIDTPGIKGFGTIDMHTDEVGHYFREIFEASRACRFGNCTHTHEPGCRVREAVEQGEIALWRYKSYLSILDDADEEKYRR